MSDPNDVLVTLVVAAWRSRPAHLQAALASARAQTHARLEILVRDDSPDEALRPLVEAFADPRIAYRRNVPARGVAANHWEAFADARGEFVAVLNHDDTLAPRFVERLVAPLVADPALALAFCDHWIIDADGRRLEARTDENSRAWQRTDLAPGRHQPFTALVLAQAIPVAMGCVFRKAALPLPGPACAGPAYDLWMAYLLARGGAGAWYEPERLSAWRDHESNLTSAAGLDWLRGAASCWSALADDAAFAGHRALARHRAADAWRACATVALHAGRAAEARRHALASLGHRWSAKGAAALVLASAAAVASSSAPPPAPPPLPGSAR